jgi:hypothetical protein
MKRTLILVAIAVPVLLISGFYLRSLVHRTFFETKPHAEAAAETQLRQEALQSEPSVQATVVLYFPDYETGTLQEEGRPMPLALNAEDRIRQIVLALIQGSRQGHSAVLPPSAVLRAVFLSSDGTAYLDFSSGAASGVPIGIESGALAVYSIVDSLAANVQAVKRVKFLIEGQAAETWDGHIDLSGYFVPNMAWASQPGTATASSQSAVTSPQ